MQSCRLPNKASRSWASPWDGGSILNIFWDVRVTCQAEFLQRSLLRKICSARGCSSCIVGCPGPTSMFDLLPRSSHSSALRHMTRRFLRALPTFCNSQWMQFQSRPGAVATNSVRLRHAAHWASWADSIKMIRRHPEVSTTILRAVDEQHASTSFHGSRIQCADSGRCGFRSSQLGTVDDWCSQGRGGSQQQPALSKRISGRVAC